MKYVELFAGCGGLSLGLESVGYNLVFANELSPMAGETYAYNLLGEDLTKIPKGECSKSVKWISSNFESTCLKERLRENPQTFPQFHENNSDLSSSLKNLHGKLLLGSIIELNKFFDQNPKLVTEIRDLGVDLVSGGPPCQSFSMAGLRQHNNHRNTLPMDFANLVSYLQPKIALLENVSGILRAFKLSDGKHYAWFEVARTFVSIDYYPICLHVNAKYAGAAQNRPRFILMAIRKDIFEKISSKTDPIINEKLMSIKSFFDKEKLGVETKPFIDLNYLDIEKESVLFDHEIFMPLKSHKENNEFHTVKDAIDDLRENNSRPIKSSYVKNLEHLFRQEQFNSIKTNKSLNHAHRENNVRVRMRFMLYQHMANLRLSKSGDEKDIQKFLREPEKHSLSNSSINFLIKKKFLMNDGKSLVKFENKEQLLEYLRQLATKKQTQRALIENLPAPAALSIPDDACHYHRGIQRTLTVREMARFQSFPDWFELRSKVTTGGKMRRYEVPQYTQVGNAVPPVLGRALGLVVRNLIDLSKKT